MARQQVVIVGGGIRFHGKGQLVEISVKVNSESFPWITYSCGSSGCGGGGGATSRGSDGFSSCSSCSGATSRGSSCTSNVVE